MAARPWESRSTMDHNGRASVKSAASHTLSVGEIANFYSRRDRNHDIKPSPVDQKARRPASHNSPSTPASMAPSLSSVNGKARPSSSKGSAWVGDNDSRSMLSVQSERYRRHSIAGSSVRDDESLASSPAFPSYMAPTSSAKARSKMQRMSPSSIGRNGTPEKGAAVSAKKRLSFTASPAGSRRYSAPPKVEMVSNKDVATVRYEKFSN